MNTSETPPDGVWFRNSPHTSDTSRITGLGVYSGERVQLQCYAWGDLVGRFNNALWYQVINVTRPTNNGLPNQGFLNAHYINDGSTSDVINSGLPQCGSSPPPVVKPTPSSDTCTTRYPAIHQATSKIIGGTETRYDRAASLYHTCEGFGVPSRISISPAMQCALIAAAATYGGPVVSVGVARGCDAGSTLADLKSGNWAGVAGGIACGALSEVFAGSVGVFVAGATAETGPGAVAIGVTAYKALSAGLKIACGGIFDGGAGTLGQKIETTHEAHVAADIERRGKCLQSRTILGQIFWSASSCTRV